MFINNVIVGSLSISPVDRARNSLKKEKLRYKYLQSIEKVSLRYFRKSMFISFIRLSGIFYK